MKQVQNNLTSYEMQTEDQIKWLVDLGWKEEQIELYFQDFGTSGTLEIEDREGMTLMLEAIQSGRVGAACAFKEDRLFRDEWNINSGFFIKACAENNVLVITRTYIYDLSDHYDRKRLRDEFERAWDDFENGIINRMLFYRQLATEKGLYDGRNVPLGYTVCYDKHNPYYKKYIPHPEHAAIIRSWFEVIDEAEGIRALLHLLATPGPHFPDTITPPAEGEKLWKGADGMKRMASHVEGGWRVETYNSARQLLRNPVYVGTWVVDDLRVQNNHPAIVDKALFNRVQDILQKRRVRYKEIAEVTQMLRGVAKYEENGIVYPVIYSSTQDYYRGHASELISRSLFAVNATALDFLFVNRLLAHIAASPQLQDYEKSAGEIAKKEASAKKTLEGKIKIALENLDGYTLSLGSPKLTEESRIRINEKMAVLEQQIKEMKEKLDTPTESSKLMSLVELCNLARDHWNEIAIEKRRALVAKSIHSVTLRNEAPHFFSMAVDWKLWGKEIAYIYRENARTPFTQQDDAYLLENYAHVPLEHLMQHFSNKSVCSTVSRAQRLGIHRPHYKVPDVDLPLQDVTFMGVWDINFTELIPGFSFWAEANAVNDGEPLR